MHTSLRILTTINSSCFVILRKDYEVIQPHAVTGVTYLESGALLSLLTSKDKRTPLRYTSPLIILVLFIS